MNLRLRFYIKRFWFNFGWFNDEAKLLSITLIEKIDTNFYVLFSLQIIKFYIGIGYSNEY